MYPNKTFLKQSTRCHMQNFMFAKKTTFSEILTIELPLGANPNQTCQYSMWEETGVPGENPRLSA
jgi:hypothetical protein